MTRLVRDSHRLASPQRIASDILFCESSHAAGAGRNTKRSDFGSMFCNGYRHIRRHFLAFALQALALLAIWNLLSPRKISSLDPRDTVLRHLVGQHPRFRGHSRGHWPGHFDREERERLLSLRNPRWSPPYPQHVALECRTLFPLTAFKSTPNPKFLQNLSQQLFWGVPVLGLKFVKNLSKSVRNCRFSDFDKFLANFSPPDWNPQKQWLGQILDKLGVWGVFECCKGKKGSQL